jgi:hypothetical protein
VHGGCALISCERDTILFKGLASLDFGICRSPGNSSPGMVRDDCIVDI